MDNNMIGSIHNTKAREAKGKTRDGGTDEDVELFSQLLEERTQKIDRDVKEPSQEEIYSDKREKEKADASEELKKAQGKAGKLSASKEALYHLASTDRSTLSLSQKSAMGLSSEGLPKGMAADEFSSLMSSRHMKMDDLSPSDRASLASKGSRGEVEKFLDTLVKEKGKVSREGAKTGAPGAPVTQEGPREATEAGTGVAAKTEESDAAERSVKREEVIKQIIEHVELRNIGNRTELTIKMNPQFLGALRLKLSLDGEKVSAEFHTESKLVRQALEESQEELTGALEKNGIKVGKVKINLVEELS
ncbi:MAG: flagellar hook-length control protein FliK [Candidatus Eremiobacteraeota bacterium]|nr:flagellar hook-length control protein FliK [Candidatus Eremiobacteraeota bacterium]